MHKLRAWPLVIDVSMMEQMALETWRNQASVIALGGLGAALGFAVLFAVIGRQFRRQAEQNAILTATAAALRASEARIGTSPKCRPTGSGNRTRIHASPGSPTSRSSGYRRGQEYRAKTRWELANGDLNTPFWRDHQARRRAKPSVSEPALSAARPRRHAANVSINGNPLFDASGAFLGYRGTGRDITAEAEAEAELLHGQGTCRERRAAPSANSSPT